MKRALIGPAFTVGLLFGQPQSSSLDAGQIYKKAAPAVVLIETHDLKGQPSARASGFLVSADGRILTNYHVVAHTKQATVVLANGDAYDTVEVLDVDQRKDIAFLKIKAVELPFLVFGRSSTVEVGDTVFSLGNPLGRLENTLSQGIISGKPQGPGYRYFQTTAAISPGSSGGPLLNAKGEVIGIVTFFLEEGQSLNFAVPIDYARGMLTSTQPQPLAAIYEPEPPPLAKPQEAPAAAPSATPQKTSQQLPEEFKRASNIFLEKQLRHWTAEDAKALLGEPVRHRAWYSATGEAYDIYAYTDPTRLHREFELSFNRAAKTMEIVFIFPWDLTWQQAKQWWGDEFREERKPDGTRFYHYKNRRLSVITRKDGKVMSWYVY